MGDAILNPRRFCFCRRPTVTLGAEDQHILSIPRAAVLRGVRWGAGGDKPTITVRFLEGDPALCDRVKAVAQEWTEFAFVTLAFVTKGPADVRIAFGQGDGSWSLLGTECKQAAASAATVNFGWLTPDSPDEELRPVVLHEFGHVLGLVHEHQSPAGGGVRWNRDAVVKAMKAPPNCWDEATTVENICSEWTRTAVSKTPLDRKSIMMYPIPVSWTLDGFSAGLNGALSEQDKELVRLTYPR